MPKANAWKVGLIAISMGLTISVVALAEDGTVILVPGATVKAPGGRIRGSIGPESPIEVKVAGQSVPVEQIEAIDYDGVPQSYAQAKIRENSGNLTEAADQYQKAATEAGSAKPLIARAAQFNRARIVAVIAAGDPTRASDAVTLLEAFIRANASSRQIGPAQEALARLFLSRGDFDKAEKVLADLSAKVPWAANRAAVLQAKVLGKRGNFDEAIAALDRMLATISDPADKRRQGALLAKAEALGGLKKFDDAEAIVREIIKNAPAEDVEAQASAHNTLGECLRTAGRPKDALVEFLHTDVLFPKDKEQHARALAQIVQLCRELKLDDQAKEASDRLKQDYPSSPYSASIGAAR